MAHSLIGYRHLRTTPSRVSAISAIQQVGITSSRHARMHMSVLPSPPSLTRPSRGQRLVHRSSSRSRISRTLFSQGHPSQLFYSTSYYTLGGDILTISSAKQPLVRAPNAIREPVLMRKLAAAGAQATLSPVRKPMSGKENAEAGPSRGRRRMEPVGEEEEEPEEEAVKPKLQGRDSPDEALYQKARVVTGNAALFGRERDNEPDAVEDLAPIHPPRRSSVHPQPPRKSAAASPPRKAMAPARMIPAPAPPRESRPTKQRVSLFETVARNLTDALHMAQTPGGFCAPSESYRLDADADVADVPFRPKGPKVFVVSWLDYCTKYGMGFAMADGTVCVHFNDSSSYVLAPGKQ